MGHDCESRSLLFSGTFTLVLPPASAGPVPTHPCGSHPKTRGRVGFCAEQADAVADRIAADDAVSVARFCTCEARSGWEASAHLGPDEEHGLISAEDRALAITNGGD